VKENNGREIDCNGKLDLNKLKSVGVGKFVYVGVGGVECVKGKVEYIRDVVVVEYLTS